ncbi:MAG: glycosyltransferase family 4 protein [Bacteroidales bacterium]
MRILIVSQYFWPEDFRINDLAISLKDRGHEVCVLTGKPNYPQGKIYEGYKAFGYAKEEYHGIEIIRVPLVPRRNGSGFNLAINYLSYVFGGCLYLLFHKREFEVSLTYAISPITQAFPALLHKKIHHSKACIWVQDLWPESVTSAGKLKSSFVLDILGKMVRHIYKHSDKILVQSEAFYESVMNQQVEPEKIRYVPNWAEDFYINMDHVNRDKYKKLMPDGFIIMFAGNIGEAQDFNSLLKAAELTKSNKEIKWVLLGDGRKKVYVESEIKRLGLEETFILLGRYPVQEMPSFFVHADMMLLSLKDEFVFSMTIPCKLQSYMAFGKPVLAMLNGIGATIVKNADCGYVSSAGDYKSLANNALLSQSESKENLLKKGQNGKSFYSMSFSKEKILDDLIDIFKE